ncbi:hypothetical protein [Spongiactinospora sp. TRM90649]|uniref:hypothetical protein n=1 Tax=Spongiactinospora sp. TRM90649 TaxID=3031114 RepID=UPI0023F90760|nr:hypothetical protein [Spongiactinospora sp. TRM90649]MDF5751186.1 hypothetical protein [Spongiactinospora sp. TRM90649]
MLKGTGSDLVKRPRAGKMLAVCSAAPALILAGWLLAALPLLLLDLFTPALALLLGVPLAALACWAGLRRLPDTIEATARQTGALLAVAAGSGVFNAVLHTEQLIVRRDPATYAQSALWLARHGSLPIPYQDAAFGGPDRALSFYSVGFYDFQGAVVPQFMPGPPLVFAVGDWLGGVTGLLLTPPVLGALAVLTVGGVAARLIGPAWAPLAGLAFAVSLPILYTSRTTFSEIPSLIMIFGAIALLLDALDRARAVPGGRDAGGARGIAASAGLVFGLATLVRIDGLRDILPVLAFAGLLIAFRRAGDRAPAGAARAGVLGFPLLGGLAAGVALGFLAAQLVTWPYLDYLRRSLVPLLAVCAVVLVVTALGAALTPRLPAVRPPRPLPNAVAALVVLAVAGLAARPWLQTVRRIPDNWEDRQNAAFIESIQRANGLPSDATRLYYEDSLYWLIWYVGIPVVLLATLAAALLARRLAGGKGLAWLLPLAIIGWTTLTTLVLPSITPDHPFAARRLVPVVIPGAVLLGVWGLRWLCDQARRRGHGRRTQRVLLAAGALLVVVPPAVVSGGTAFTPVERGEAAAVAGLCAAIPRDASVLIVERVTGDRFTQVVRGMCGVPTARVHIPAGAADRDVAAVGDVTRLTGRIREAGRRPVLLAASGEQLAPFAGTAPPRQVMRLRTRQDERSLISPPNATWSLSADVWMATP